ncbi:DinB family protein [Saccharomonospora sp. NPDC046836]|uniref:DinB family protein n=1 Tax=Saccharomonospora sp. NPDC046836 TaxID=3156921 RepID=UPI0033F81BDA
MTAPPNRPEPPLAGGEREQLTGFLDFLRATVVWKSTGVTEEQARRQLVPSRLTTIAGLLGHLIYMEQYWFCVVLDGRPDPWREALSEDRNAEFRGALEMPMERLIAAYERQCDTSRRIAAGLALDHEVPFRGEGTINARFVLVHMIEETGRHAGHLDLLRELTDGLVGE